MRRTAATIAAGENRLRHLALHDPLCGLPNRIFFGERLEAMIAKVQQRRPAGRGVLHRPRPLQGRQRHARPSDRRRADPQRHAAADPDAARRRPGRAPRRRRVRRHHRRAAPTTPTLQAIADAHDRHALRALLDQQPDHRDRRQHRHRRHRRACRRRRRHHALRRHGALPRQERRPQPRLHLRRGDGRRPAPAQAARERSARRRSRTTSLRVAYQPIVNNSGETVVGVEALAAGRIPSAARFRRPNSSRSPRTAG